MRVTKARDVACELAMVFQVSLPVQALLPVFSSELLSLDRAVIALIPFLKVQ